MRSLFAPSLRGYPAVAMLLLAVSSPDTFAIHADETVTVEGHGSGSLTVPSIASAREALGRIAGGASVVDAESYRTGRVGTLQDTLGMTAGVFVQPRFGAEEARLSIRGSGLQRTFHLRGIALLQDGIPLTLADGSGDFQAIDPLATDYIEVYRGANALQYGASTLGGAINFVAPTGHTAAPATARIEYGSFDYKRAQLAGGAVRGSADYFGSLGYSAQDGYRAHARQQNLRLQSNFGYALGDALETRLYFTLADTDSELPGNLTRRERDEDPQLANPANLLGDQKRDFFLWRVANRTVYDLGHGRVEFSMFYAQKDLFHPIFQVLDQITADYGLALRYVNDAPIAGRANQFIIGFMPHWGDTADDRFQNVAGRRGIRTAQLELRAANYAVFLENQHHVLPRLALVTGLQLARSERRLDDLLLTDGDASFDTAYSAVNPKLGFRYEFNELTELYGNVSRSFEPPSFGELSGAQLINVLADQSATSFEIGSRGEESRLHTRWDFTYYRAWVQDEFLSLTDPRGNPLGTVSAAETIHQGLEVALETTLLARWVLRQTWLWMDLHFGDDRIFGDNALAGVPEHLYRADLVYQSPRGYYAGPTVEWVPMKYAIDHANTVFASGYALAGLRAGFRRERGFSWFVDLRNLGDTNYIASTGVVANAAGRDTAQFLPGDGLAAYGGLEYRF